MDDNDKALDSAEGEDIPSDFFDDFSREDFVEGLSVVDSWDECDKDRHSKRTSESKEPDVEKDPSMKDQRYYDREREERHLEKEVKYMRERQTSNQRRSVSNTKLDDYIKPGSRRDPSKTNEAIRRDKEVKVKEHLAKHLDSTIDIRPPGTELDDFFDVDKTLKKTKSVVPKEAYKKVYRSRSREYRELEHRSSPRHRSFKYEEHNNSYRSSNCSPRSNSPRRYQSRNWRPSPIRIYKRHSPHRQRIQHYSPRRSRRSRSPYHSNIVKSRRSSTPQNKDSFLYPNISETQVYMSKNAYDSSSSYIGAPTTSYSSAPINEFSIQGSAYIQDQVYTSDFSGYNGYTGPLVQPTIPDPQLVPVPVMDQISAPIMNLSQPPSMVPAPTVMASSNTAMQQYQMDKKSPYDALAQLVADGKLSQEDYLKLAPNRGGSIFMDDKAKVMVLSRCDEAISKLSKLVLPNNLLINNNSLGSEPKSITPKYCSPLKRQQDVEFHFTKPPSSLTVQQNKQLLDRIIACIGVQQQVSKLKKKNKNMKDAAVQTTKPYCDVCEIRETTMVNDIGTSIDADYFSSTIHTQVVEQDLLNSKTIFNPSGSIGSSEPISIAHLTPAQLVSQLAARAKTLKQTETVQPSSPFGRRNQPNSYDGRGSGQQYHYNNYRY